MTAAIAPAEIRLEGLVVRRGMTLAVDRVSLAVEPGIVTAVVGPSGCGKTTLLRAIAGFERPEAGWVEIGGKRVASSSEWIPPERRRVGMVFQEGALFPHLDVGQNVRYGVRGRADAERRVSETLELVGLAALAHRMPHELSGGQQQRVALARALAPEPRVVLLDEPFVNLDAGLRQRVRDDVRRILEDARVTAVLVTHDQEEALSTARRVAVMAAGRILQVGEPEEIYLRPATPRVADLVGDGRLVSCLVAAGRFESAFGGGECDGEDGEGRLLLRPEDLELLPADSERGVPGTVVGRQFYGHDVVDRVELESGELVDVRTLAPVAVTSGDAVRLALRGRRFRVFRKASD